MKRLFAIAVTALALAGCMVGPNYRSPEPGAPSQDPFSLFFMAAPMYVFYEAAIILGRILKK